MDKETKPNKSLDNIEIFDRGIHRHLDWEIALDEYKRRLNLAVGRPDLINYFKEHFEELTSENYFIAARAPSDNSLERCGAEGIKPPPTFVEAQSTTSSPAATPPTPPPYSSPREKYSEKSQEKFLEPVDAHKATTFLLPFWFATHPNQNPFRNPVHFELAFFCWLVKATTPRHVKEYFRNVDRKYTRGWLLDLTRFGFLTSEPLTDHDLSKVTTGFHPSKRGTNMFLAPDATSQDRLELVEHYATEIRKGKLLPERTLIGPEVPELPIYVCPQCGNERQLPLLKLLEGAHACRVCWDNTGRRVKMRLKSELAPKKSNNPTPQVEVEPPQVSSPLDECLAYAYKCLDAGEIVLQTKGLGQHLVDSGVSAGAPDTQTLRQILERSVRPHLQNVGSFSSFEVS